MCKDHDQEDAFGKVHSITLRQNDLNVWMTTSRATLTFALKRRGPMDMNCMKCSPTYILRHSLARKVNGN